MLTEVTIEGLRGVGRVELRFSPGQRVYTLFGENGVGKTKCLEALYLLCLSQTRWRAADTSGIRRAEDSGQPSEIVFRTNNPSAIGKKVSFGLKAGEIPECPVVYLGADRRASMEAADGNEVAHLGGIEKRRKDYFDGIRKALESDAMKSLGMECNTRAWFVQRAHSASPYQKSKDDRSVEIDTVLSLLNAVEEGVDPEFLQIDGDNRVFLKVEGEQREFAELSSGFISLVKLLQAIVAGYAAFTNETQLKNVRGIVLIDEIDSHLHAQWQAKIIPLLKKLLPNTTFYIATHSPIVLSQLMQGEAYSLKRGEDGVVRNVVIDYPNRRLFADVLEDGTGIDLNALKLGAMDSLNADEQGRAKAQLMEAKARLLRLLEAQAEM